MPRNRVAESMVEKDGCDLICRQAKDMFVERRHSGRCGLNTLEDREFILQYRLVAYRKAAEKKYPRCSSKTLIGAAAMETFASAEKTTFKEPVNPVTAGLTMI